MSKRRLGKGIDALLGDVAADEEIRASISEVDLADIESDPNQPRKSFSAETLDELADSIRSRGVIQPIILEDRGGEPYRIVAGERRFRAAKLAGLTTVPAIIRTFTDDEKYEIALIENIQREDLNPIEEARGYQTVMERYGLTQEEIAQRLGKKRSTVANSLRLLRLSDDMQSSLVEGKITAGHARALLSVTDPLHRDTLFAYCLDEEVSVRDAERAAASLNESGSLLTQTHASGNGASGQKASDVGGTPASGRSGEARPAGGSQAGVGDARKTPELLAVEERLITTLGTKVVINGSENRGRIEIAYFSLDDLNRLLDLLNPS